MWKKNFIHYHQVYSKKKLEIIEYIQANETGQNTIRKLDHFEQAKFLNFECKHYCDLMGNYKNLPINMVTMPPLLLGSDHEDLKKHSYFVFRTYFFWQTNWISNVSEKQNTINNDLRIRQDFSFSASMFIFIIIIFFFGLLWDDT